MLSTQLDWEGGVLAANDSDVIQFNRDTYSYVWLRDGALTAHAGSSEIYAPWLKPSLTGSCRFG